MPRAYRSMLSFFQLVNDVPGYEELGIEVSREEEDSSRIVQWVGNEGIPAHGGVSFSTFGHGHGEDEAT